MIAQKSIEKLLDTIDIISTIESYLPLKKKGGNFTAPCPFHSEKTPSFVVSPQKQIYHCFGCGVGGNAIKFVQEIERLSFPEAIEKLASENNIVLEYEGGDRRSISNEALEQYNKFCINKLADNSIAMKYLESRGLTQYSIDEFEIGYSPKSAEIINYVKENFLIMEEVLELDILRYGDNGLYATFTERIMFPIRNASGKLCGFSGRTLIDHKAKYLNTKDTPLFNKSAILFGYHQAKQYISKKRDAIITEGQMDVIMMHQAGLKNTVASMGTSLTKQHLPLISRVTKRCSLMFDGDNAGVTAAFKAATILMQSQVDVGVSIVDEGRDPADLVAEGDIEGVKAILRSQVYGIKFCADRILLGYDLNNPFQKQEALVATSSYGEELSLIVKEYFLSYVASVVGYVAPVVYRPIIGKNRSAWEMLQLSILKTIINSDSSNIDLSELEEIVNCFTYVDAVKSLIRGDASDEMIGEIFLDDSIITLDSLEVGILSFKISCMKRWVDRTVSSTILPPDVRISKMREGQMKIRELEEKFRRLEHGDD